MNILWLVTNCGQVFIAELVVDGSSQVTTPPLVSGSGPILYVHYVWIGIPFAQVILAVGAALIASVVIVIRRRRNPEVSRRTPGAPDGIVP